jgi:hypothetical protein
MVVANLPANLQLVNNWMRFAVEPSISSRLGLLNIGNYSEPYFYNKIKFGICTDPLIKICQIIISLHRKIVVLAVFALFFGLLGSATAHKSEVIGNYEIEIGWENEPPIVGKENAIIIMIMSASTDETVEEHDGAESDDAEDSMTESDDAEDSMTESDDAEDSMTESDDAEDSMTESDDAEDSMTESDDAGHDDESEHEHDDVGIPGLASILEVTVTLDDEETILEMTEDAETPGLYIGAYTPTKVGQPLVHVFGTIDEDTIEVTFHPEEVENAPVTPIQQQNNGVEPKDVTCPEDLVLLGKKTTNTAICVTQKTADLLIARGWAFLFE